MGLTPAKAKSLTCIYTAILSIPYGHYHRLLDVVSDTHCHFYPIALTKPRILLRILRPQELVVVTILQQIKPEPILQQIKPEPILQTHKITRNTTHDMKEPHKPMI